MTRARDLADGTFANDLTVDTNTLYVDSTNNRVGVGTTSPSDLLHIYSGSSGATPSVNTRVLIEDAGNAALQILTGTTSNGQILFGDSGSAAVGRVQYEHATNDMAFYTNGSEAARIDSSGTVYFKDGGSSNPAIRFLNDTDTGIFRPSANTIAFTNGGSESARIDSSGRVGIGQTPTTDLLEVNGDVRAVDFNATSDERLKSNIRKIEGALDKVCQMNGMHYVLDGKEASGVIAQNVQTVAPEAVADEGEYMTVAYNQLIGYLIEAVKELKTEVEELKNGNASSIS